MERCGKVLGVRQDCPSTLACIEVGLRRKLYWMALDQVAGKVLIDCSRAVVGVCQRPNGREDRSPDQSGLLPATQRQDRCDRFRTAPHPSRRHGRSHELDRAITPATLVVLLLREPPNRRHDHSHMCGSISPERDRQRAKAPLARSRGNGLPPSALGIASMAFSQATVPTS